MQLVGGQLVEVPATLIKRQKFHFHHLEALGKLMLRDDDHGDGCTHALAQIHQCKIRPCSPLSASAKPDKKAISDAACTAPNTAGVPLKLDSGAACGTQMPLTKALSALLNQEHGQPLALKQPGKVGYFWEWW